MVHSLPQSRFGRALRRAALISLGLPILVWLLTGGRSLAAGNPYTAGSSGYDVSYPDCSSPSSPTGTFAIIGVTGGRAFTNNPCLASEVSAAVRQNATVSFYMNLNTAIGSTSSEGDTGPAGRCAKANKACVDYNYGYNAAVAAYGATSELVAAPVMWWLDIETGNSWSRSSALNDDVIEGAVDFLQTKGDVGIYSTAAMWTTIAGSTFQPGTLPVPGGQQVGAAVQGNWVPASACPASALFPNGVVWVIQHSTTPYDQDSSC